MTRLLIWTDNGWDDYNEEKRTTKTIPLKDIKNNEEKRLPSALDQILGYFRDKKINYEVIVVDDGSADGTTKVVNEYSSRFPHIKGITLKENSGKNRKKAKNE